MLKTVWWWIIWGVISFWALETFYYSFTSEKLERLRKAALGINIAVVILGFLPWLPSTLGGKSGWTVALEGNLLVLMFMILLVASVLLSATKGRRQLKIAAVTTIVNTGLIFIIMIQLRPETFVASWYDIAPITAGLFLLINTVVVLLLWQQLQLRERPLTPFLLQFSWTWLKFPEISAK